MSKEKELKIVTATVTIQLITVDGKRMTKAVFNQIENEVAFDTLFQFIGDSILGYVNSDSKWLLFVKGGRLRKMNISVFNKIASERYIPDYNKAIKYALPEEFQLEYHTWLYERKPVCYINRKIEPYCQYNNILEREKSAGAKEILSLDKARSVDGKLYFTDAEWEAIEAKAREEYDKNESKRVEGRRKFLTEQLLPFRKKVNSFRKENEKSEALFSVINKNVSDLLDFLDSQQLYIAI
jgi:hypothetical protein